MIAIIADDFSGAAELAGIAAARGFKAEVQTSFDPDSDAGVIAVNTDTRLQPESEAVRVMAAVSARDHRRRSQLDFQEDRLRATRPHSSRNRSRSGCHKPRRLPLHPCEPLERPHHS